VVVSFIGVENRRKPLTCCMSLPSFITSCIKYILPWVGFELTIFVVIGTDCIGSCKSNYHMITTKTAPLVFICTPQINKAYLVTDSYRGKARNLNNVDEKEDTLERLEQHLVLLFSVKFGSCFDSLSLEDKHNMHNMCILLVKVRFIWNCCK
jgi:hypothetical protein